MELPILLALRRAEPEGTRFRAQEPHDVAVDHAGNLVISDTFNNRMRVVAARSGTFYGIAMTKGDIYTVGGDGPSGWNGDGIPGLVGWEWHGDPADIPGLQVLARGELKSRDAKPGSWKVTSRVPE